MRIHRLEVEGFRSLKKVSWEPGTLNVVIGPNGSGKSNLLRLLEFIQRLAFGGLKEYINRSGGFTNISWDGESSPIKISSLLVDLSIHKFHQGFPPFPLGEQLAILYSCLIQENVPYLPIISEEKIFMQPTPPLSFMPKMLMANRSGEDLSFFLLEEEHKQDSSFLDKSESILPYYTTNLNQYSVAPWALQGNLKTWKIYQYFDANKLSAVRQPAITSYEKAVGSDGYNIIQVLHTLYTSDRNFESDIDSAMNAAFGNDYEKLVFPPAADQRVQLRIRWKTLKREQSALDISDGTLRFLYLMAILANPEPSPLIAIDEPETGLHPSMFPIIAEFARECSRKSQVIFTTHSPQFLDAFGDRPPTTTVAQWQNGETILKVLDGERLSKWLKHYSLGHMFMSGELEAFD